MKDKEWLEKKADVYERVFFVRSGAKKLVLRALLSLFGKKSNRYTSLLREYKHIDLSKVSDSFSDIDDVGLVVQGPVCKTDDFTLETIELYRKIYPNMAIVLSTWEGELCARERQKLEELNCSVLESPSIPLQNKGKGAKPSAVNNQLFSTLRGIKELKKNDKCKYILKMRSDLRCYKPNFVCYFRDMLEMYPSSHMAGTDRLLAVSFSNMKYFVPFHMSDFIWFGSVDDMQEFYSTKFQDQNALSVLIEKWENPEFIEPYKNKIQRMMNGEDIAVGDMSWYDKLDIDEEFMLSEHAECYFAYSYFSRVMEDVLRDKRKNLLEKYYEFIRRKIIVVDEEELNIYWNKEASWNFRHDSFSYEKSKLTHARWIHMVKNIWGKINEA